MIDLEAITDLVLAECGYLVSDRDDVIAEINAWAVHRSRRVVTRTATKKQLLGQLDRAFPGLTLALPTCWPPGSVGWSPPSSPTRRGWLGSESTS